MAEALVSLLLIGVVFGIAAVVIEGGIAVRRWYRRRQVRRVMEDWAAEGHPAHWT